MYNVCIRRPPRGHQAVKVGADLCCEVLPLSVDCCTVLRSDQQATGPKYPQSSGLWNLPSSTLASRPFKSHPNGFRNTPEPLNNPSQTKQRTPPNIPKPYPGLPRSVTTARGGPAAGGVALKKKKKKNIYIYIY